VGLSMAKKPLPDAANSGGAGSIFAGNALEAD
jgi:hypothetical protein